MNKGGFIESIVNFFKKHEILAFFSMYSFVVPLVPFALYFQNSKMGLLQLIVITSPFWLMIIFLKLEKEKLVKIFFVIYLIWGTVFAVLVFEDYALPWIAYIVSIIISIISAINIANS